MQHFRVKFFARPTPAGFDLGQAIPVFHRWIQKDALPETMIDVADYQHVPAGPGVLLVSHDAYYGLDQSKHRLGLLYTRRTTLDGPVSARIRAAIDSALRACDLLEREPEFAGKLSFDRANFEVSVNDRLLSPNSDAGYRELEPELRAALAPGKCELVRVGDPRELLTISVTRP
jgi:hypothetical protein